ncbi:GNAT family N-acetyltransferase [Actinocorallia lasiicapitis]
MIGEVSGGRVREALPELADLLLDSVAGGASIGFLDDLDGGAAAAWWDGVAAKVEAGETVMLAAEDGGRIVGTVLLHLVGFPGGRHRAELAKLLVHSDVRRRGIARALLAAAEKTALAAGRTLLVLDTESGSAAESLYRAEGWTEAGTIPGYAAVPDGALIATTFYYKTLTGYPQGGKNQW